MKEEDRRPTGREAVLTRWSEAARRGEAPTREAWWDDLRRLGAIDLETAGRLTDGGGRWPWIAPFEIDQVEELLRRAVEAGAGELIRRAAAPVLEARLRAAPDPFGDEATSYGTPPIHATPPTRQTRSSHRPGLETPAETTGELTESGAGGPDAPPSPASGSREGGEKPARNRSVDGAPAPGRTHDRAAREPHRASSVPPSAPPSSAPPASSSSGSAFRVAVAAGGARSAEARRRLLIAAVAAASLTLVLGLVLGLGSLLWKDSPPPTAPRSQTPTPPPIDERADASDSAETIPATPPEAAGADLAPLLLELSGALEASGDPRLRALFEHRVEPLLTLDGEAMRRRPEMADAVTVAAWLRAAGDPAALAREAPLLTAVHCGTLGPQRPERPAACADPAFVEAAVEALRGLVAWVWSSSETAPAPRPSEGEAP